VLDRIEMDVIEVPRKTVLLAQRMLPISPLPNPALCFGGATGGDPFVSGQTMRKAPFDQAPTRGEIRIAIGQSPDRVQVVRQDHRRFDRDGCRARTRRNVARNKSIWSVNSARRRSARLTVKKITSPR
jgi:hypothetical protein